jgi:copper(I)-binding protein
MRQVQAIELPAGKTVELKPGGLHIMLVGLKAPLKAGDRFPMKLTFAKAGEVTVDVMVQAAGPDAMQHPMPHDMKH